MRALLTSVVIALLILPGLAWGQSTEVVPNSQMTGLGMVNPSGQIDFNPAVHSSIVIDVLITATQPLDGSQYSIVSDLNGGGVTTGDLDWVYAASNPWTNGGLYAPGDYRAGVGLTGGGGTLASVYGTGIAEMYFTYDSPPTPGTAALIATYVLEPAGLLTDGDTYTIYAANDPPNTFLENGYADQGGLGGGPWQATLPVTVNIVPEPATALFMIGAVLLLRRRLP